MKKIFLAALSSVAMAATMGAAQAAIVTYTETATIPSASVPFVNLNGDDTPYAFTLDAFNRHWGALSSVELILTNNSTPYITVIDLNHRTSTHTSDTYSNATASVPLTVTGPGGTSITATVVDGPHSGTVSRSTTNFNEITLPGTTTTQMDSLLLTSGLGAFESWSLTPLSLSYNATADDGGTYSGTGNNIAFTGGSLTGGTFEIVYTYDNSPVPEAAVWTMLMLGFGMIGLVLRAGRNNAAMRTA